MKFSLKAESRRDVYLHVGIVIAVAAIMILSFFYIYLPVATHHGETITVPNIVGMKIDELEDFLDSKDLEYVVDDSTYNPNEEPLTVYSQYPLPGAKVKQGRKVYISINAKHPPKVKMPSLANRSLISAQGELESYGLQLGEIRYVPDLQQNYVLKQIWNGREIPEGAMVPKGAKIDLVVGDGLGNQEFDVPDLVGKPQDEAEITLSGSGLQIGIVINQANTGVEPGTVVKQRPEAGTKIRVGDVVDIWVAGTTDEVPQENPTE